MMSPLDLILIDGATATGAGLAVGFGTEKRYGAGVGSTTPNSNQFPKKMKVRVVLSDSSGGATASVQYQDSPDNVTWTTRYTQALTVPAAAPYSNAHGFLFTTQKRYFRLNVSALANGTTPTVDAYMSIPPST